MASLKIMNTLLFYSQVGKISMMLNSIFKITPETEVPFLTITDFTKIIDDNDENGILRN